MMRAHRARVGVSDPSSIDEFLQDGLIIGDVRTALRELRVRYLER